MDFGVVGLVLAPSPPVQPAALPTSPSMLSAVRESPEPVEKLAVMVEDWPTFMLAPRDEVMLAVGDAGAVTVRVPPLGEQDAVPPGPDTLPV